MIFVIELFLIVMFFYFAVTQIMIPIYTNTPLFPVFRNKVGNELASLERIIRQELENQELKAEILDLKEKLEQGQKPSEKPSTTINISEEEDQNEL